MRRLTVGAILTVAVLTLSALVVPIAGANRDGGGETSPPVAPPPGQAADSQDETPYIGVMIERLSSDDLSAMGLDGGAKVVTVLEDGPSAGVLQVGDVITAVGGTDTTTIEEVVEAVRGSTPAEALSITVRRGAETLKREVTVGGREVAVTRTTVRSQVRTMAGEAGLPVISSDFAKFEFTVEADGGYKTYSGARGTPGNIDVEAGTFDLTPKDGSDPISYRISPTTQVVISHLGDLGGLDTEQETLVLSEDGTVTHVLQGEGMTGQMPSRLYFEIWDPRGVFEGEKRRVFEWERGPGSSFTLPPEIRDILRDFRVEIEEIETRRAAGDRGR